MATVEGNIRKYAEEHGIRNKFLAAKVGVTDSKMSFILHERQKIGCIELFKLSEALGVPMETFFEGVND